MKPSREGADSKGRKEERGKGKTTGEEKKKSGKKHEIPLDKKKKKIKL